MDKLLKFYLKLGKDRSADPDYHPDKAIKSKRLLNPGQDSLAVIFPGWHGGSGFLYEKLAKRLVRQGWSVLVYKFDDNIIEADDATVIKSFKQIQKQVVQDLNEFKGYSHIRLIGISLGNVALAMCAENFRGFDSATLVAAGDDLAWDLWHGILTQDIRRGFEMEKVKLPGLDNDWRSLAPKNNLDNFAGKPVKMYIATKDRVIHASYQEKLAAGLRGAKAELSVKRLRTDHAGLIIRFCYFGKLDF